MKYGKFSGRMYQGKRKRKVGYKMSKKLLSEEAVIALKASPYVESVSERSVVFTAQFKALAYEELRKGKAMTDIFEEHGIDSSALGKARINGFREKVEIAAKREAGFENLRKQKRQKKEAAPEDKLERRVRQLEHQLAYAQQEVEFLKKIQQADTEARIQWESKHRQK